MTRKEELHARANNFLHQHHHFKNGKPRNCDLECLREMLLHVEREVWARVINKLEEDLDIGTFTMIDWCKKQQEGL